MLTEAQIKNAKPKEKRYMLRDEHGLYLEVIPSGTKSWRFRYWVDKKEYKVTIGKYPLISLKDARERRDKLRVLMIDGGDPARAQPQSSVTFETAWREWTEKKVIPTLSPAYVDDLSARARNHILPFLGGSPITGITSVDVLRVLRRIEATGHIHNGAQSLSDMRPRVPICYRVRILRERPNWRFERRVTDDLGQTPGVHHETG